MRYVFSLNNVLSRNSSALKRMDNVMERIYTLFPDQKYDKQSKFRQNPCEFLNTLSFALRLQMCLLIHCFFIFFVLSFDFIFLFILSVWKKSSQYFLRFVFSSFPVFFFTSEILWKKRRFDTFFNINSSLDSGSINSAGK